MKGNGYCRLLLWPWIPLGGLWLTEFFELSFPGIGRLGLWAAVSAASLYMGYQTIRSSRELKGFTAELNHAVSRSGQTRLLSKGHPGWDEARFAVNELLDRLERVEIGAIRSESARRRLLSEISHDIRTPLTSIIGYVDALRDGIAETEQERKQYLSIISGKAAGLSRWVDDMFTMAKLDADDLPHHPELCDLAELTREAVIAFLPDLNVAGLELRVQIPESPCFVFADPVDLGRMIANVAKNAIHYGREGGILGIELDAAMGHWELHIWDRGPGLNAQDQEHLFDRAYRGEASGKSGTGGSGLGLAITKALADRNRVMIRIESEPWRKTLFGFSFPISGSPS